MADLWETTYWSSSTASPDSLQDPWKDAMAYVSGYGTPKGAKQFWGNCDGRYLVATMIEKLQRLGSAHHAALP